MHWMFNLTIAVSALLITLLASIPCHAQGGPNPVSPSAAPPPGTPSPLDRKVKLPQRLMLATELLREISIQTGVGYAYPTGALVRQIDVSPFAGEATVNALVAKLAPTVSWRGGVVVLEANLADARLKELADKLASDKAAPDDRRVAAYELGNTKSTRAIAPLFAALDDKDESVRHHALRSLDRLERDLAGYCPPGRVSIFTLAKDAPADKLVEILKSAPDATTNEWIWSAGLIGRLGRPLTASQPLQLNMANGYLQTRKTAEWALTRLSGPMGVRPPASATPASLASAADLARDFKSAKTAEAAADLLLQIGRAGGQAAWDLLLAKLGDGDPVIRQAAIRGLSRCPDPRAVPALVAIVVGPEAEPKPAVPETVPEKGTPPSAMSRTSEYRNLAAMSLGMIGSPAVVQQLADYIARTAKPISSAALALSWTCDGGNPAAEPALLDCIAKKDTDKNNTTNDVLRSYAYVGLARIGSAAAVNAIMTKYDEYDNTARFVGHSSIRLAGRWSPSAVDRFVELVRTGKGRIAPHGLEEAEDPRAVDALIEACPKSKGDRLDFALQALGRIGDPKAVPALVALLDHPEQWVRYEAVRALRWRWYWGRPDVKAAIAKNPVFKALAAPPPSLAEQPDNSWVCRNWPIDFDDYRAVNTSYEAGMAFDESTGLAVKSNGHGQRCDTPQLGETWRYDPAANLWSQSDSPVTPFGMCGTWNITYDRSNQRVVALEAEGGHHGWQWERGRALRGSSPWVYNGKQDSWTPMNPLHALIGPGLRGFGPLVYMDKSRRVFLHGSAWGGNSDKALADRSWTYDACTNTWTMLPEMKDGPGNRSAHAMCYLPRLDKVLLAPGGKDGKTWLFDPVAGTWADAQAKGNPPKLGLPMVYDPVSATALVFHADANGTVIWQYDPAANSWAKLDSPLDFSPHHDSVDVVYDPKDNVFIMDGGHVNWNTDHIAVREVWTYRFKKVKAAPAAGNGGQPAPVSPSAKPPYPDNVVVSVLPDRTVNVRWARPEATGEGSPAGKAAYNVYAATVEIGPRLHHKEVFQKVGEFVKLNQAPIQETEFVDARKLADAAGKGSLFNHEIRAYQVRSVAKGTGAAAESGPSATVLTLTSSVPRATAVEQPDGSTLIRWQESAEKGLLGYAVYRMDEFRTTLAVRLNAVPVKDTAYVDWCESPRAERRRYYVVAVDALNQEGVPSTGAWAFGRP